MKECVHTQLHEAEKEMIELIDFTKDTEYQMMVKNGMIDFTQDSEYKRLYERKTASVGTAIPI